MKKVKNIVFYSQHINIRLGGPSGYIANLLKGMALTDYAYGSSSIVFVNRDSVKQKFNLYKIIKGITSLIPSRVLRKRVRSWFSNNIYSLNEYNTQCDSCYYSDFIPVLNSYDFETIICHWVKDALFIKNYLKKANKNAKVILMSHSPQPPSQEIYDAERLDNNPDAEMNYFKWQRIEKDAFLNAADILLFPSKEAIEPYSSTLEYFQEIEKNKRFLFLPTGCCQLELDKNCVDFRKKYNITTPYVISYIGRHNKIKGYDLLKEIASEILRQRDDVTFLIGGKLSSDIQPLNHPRWIELGFVNPPDVLSVSDCFILPNRQTYFDLVLLEVMSMGVPVFASATGGNKTVYKATNAINLYESLDECVEKVNKYLDLDANDKKYYKEKTLQAYYDNYTLEIFARNYVKIIESL